MRQSQPKDCLFCKPLDKDIIIRNYKYWTLFLDDGQVTLGWALAVHKGHIEYFEQLSVEELAELKKLVVELKFALAKTFQPDWFNVMQCGNMVHHLHFHLAPRYAAPRIFARTGFIDKNYGHMPDIHWEAKDKKLLRAICSQLKKNFP